MIGDILIDLKSTFNDLGGGTPTRTITVAKPYCAPCRGIVMTALQNYGVRVHGYEERAQTVSARQAFQVSKMPSTETPTHLPVAQVARVTVSEKQAAWAEYLLLRTGKLHVIGDYVNRRNEAWAARHGGRMPVAWQEGKPWIERSCSEGKHAWRQAKRVANSVGSRR